jgi:hypothetical protein
MDGAQAKCGLSIECYLPLNRKEVLTHATMWVNLKDVMISEIKQFQEENYYSIPLYAVPRGVKLMETK